MIAWNVFLYGAWKDTVFYTPDCDREYVYQTLTEHDGYSTAIKVFRR